MDPRTWNTGTIVDCVEQPGWLYCLGPSKSLRPIGWITHSHHVNETRTLIATKGKLCLSFPFFLLLHGSYSQKVQINVTWNAGSLSGIRGCNWNNNAEPRALGLCDSNWEQAIVSVANNIESPTENPCSHPNPNRTPKLVDWALARPTNVRIRFAAPLKGNCACSRAIEFEKECSSSHIFEQNRIRLFFLSYAGTTALEYSPNK